MRILVTGCAGFIGSHVSDQLLTLGHTVIGVDNFSDYYDIEIKKANTGNALTHPQFSLHRIDLTDCEALTQIFASNVIDWVIHLAAQPGVRASIDDPLRTQHNNITATYTLFEAARIAQVRNIVFASSSSVYGGSTRVPFIEDEPLTTPLSPYAASKQACELIAYTYHALYDMNMIGLRFFTVYGERGRPDMSPYLFIDALMRGTPLTQFGDGHQERDFTYIDDIVAGIVACLDTQLGYDIINLGNSSPVSLKEYIALLEKITDKKAHIMEKPEQAGEMRRTCADISKAKRLLNWSPTTSLENGLTNMLRWYKTL